jgi:Flp pilus assembly protein TadG
MMRASMRSGSRTGVAAVEFAILAPLILTLLMGLWEVGRLVEMQQVLTNAAREGGRAAATGQMTNTQVQAVITQYLAADGFPTGNVVITITTPQGDVSKANYLDPIQISVTIPYNDVKWSLLGIVTQPGDLIKAQVEWISMVDQSFPTPTNPPTG